MTTDSETRPDISFGYAAPGRAVLCATIKRRYIVAPDGRCHPDPEQGEAVAEPQAAEDEPLRLERDSDLWPIKPQTDLVIRGSAWNPGADRAFTAAVQIAGRGKLLRVSGPRRCSRAHGGGYLFSDPDAVESVPLHAGFAYGGVDRRVEERVGNHAALMGAFVDPAAKVLIDRFARHAYPRNPVGRGFLIEDAPGAVEELALPQLEDPDDLLTPERLVVGALERWATQPIPAHFGWLDLSWFPRSCHFDIRPEVDPDPGVDWPEVRRGWLRAEDCERRKPPLGDQRMANGAVVDLRFSDLSGGERVQLTNCKQGAAKWTVQLPGSWPKIRLTLANGKRAKAAVALHTIDIQPDANRVELVWGGQVTADRPYMLPELAELPCEIDW